MSINYLQYIPKEILIEILKECVLYQLIRMTEVEIKIKLFIRSTQWDHIVVKSRNINHIRHIIDNYIFSNYDLCQSNVEDDEVIKLKNCYYLNLSSCEKITDKSVSLLGN